jgi:HPr kinase/phosphorylase
MFEDNRKELRLRIINNKKGFHRKIESVKLNRPGLELTGFWEYFKPKKILVFGMKEKKYLDTISGEQIETIFDKLFSQNIPCAIFAHQTKPPDIVVQLANKYNVTLIKTTMLTSELNQCLVNYLRWTLAPRKKIHGTLVDVYGVGLLITGRSGIGKSEIALDLVERGHRLISDDSVNIIRRSDDVLIGKGNELLEHYLEIRGIGIINIAKMYGLNKIFHSLYIINIVEAIFQ